MPFKLTVTHGPGAKAGGIVLKRLDDKFWPRLAKGFTGAGQLLVAQIRQNLSGPGRRQIAWLSKRQERKFAQRPPQSRLHDYPGVVSGKLRRSVKFKIQGSGQGMSLVVGPHVVYAAIHEFGGKIDVSAKMRGFLHAHGFHLSKRKTQITIPARPYVWPAYEKQRREIVRVIGRELIRK